jgi:hypothetical protein
MKEKDFFQIKVSKRHALKAVLLVAVLIIFLGTCAAKGEEDPVSQNIDPRCPTGYTIRDVPHDRENMRFWIFVLTPNEGCNLPPESCKLTGSGGLSCTIIEPVEP